MRYKDKKIPQDLFSILRDIFCYIAVQIKTIVRQKFAKPKRLWQ